MAGSIFLAILLANKKEIFKPKAIIAGIVLGVPNYFSIYTYIQAMQSNIMRKSALIPVNNIGIVIVSTIAAIIFFKQKLSKINYIGLALAVLAIGLIMLGDYK